MVLKGKTILKKPGLDIKLLDNKIIYIRSSTKEFSEKDSKEMSEAMYETASKLKHPRKMLVNAKGAGIPPATHRSMIMDSFNASKIDALALVGFNPILRVIAKPFLNLIDTVTTMKFFGSEKAALEWLTLFEMNDRQTSRAA